MVCCVLPGALLCVVVRRLGLRVQVMSSAQQAPPGFVHQEHVQIAAAQQVDAAKSGPLKRLLLGCVCVYVDNVLGCVFVCGGSFV
jgi:hypothetical protein